MRHIKAFTIITFFISIFIAPNFAQADLITSEISQGLATHVSTPYQISTDGKYVVYILNNHSGLYSSPIDGTNPINLSEGNELEPGESKQWVIDFKISPDSQSVIFRQIINGEINLYAISITGSNPTRLNGPMDDDGNVTEHYDFSPDGSKAAYIADEDEDNKFELYISSIADGKSIKLSHSISQSSDVGIYLPDSIGDRGIFKFSPDGQRVVYTVSHESYAFFSVSVDGGDAIQLNDPIVGQINLRSVYLGNFEISPDSRYVLYMANQEAAHFNDLYLVSILGGEQTKINDSFTSDQALKTIELPQFSPDGSHIIYLAEQEKADTFHLYSKPTAGGESVQLNPASVEIAHPIHIDANSSRVVYTGWQNTGTFETTHELFSVPISGGEVIKLNNELPAGSDGFALRTDHTFAISPDGQNVVFRLDQEEDDVYELFSVSINGGAVTKLNSSLVEGGDVGGGEVWPAEGSFKISPAGDFVYYVADAEVDHQYELYKVPIGGGTTKKMNATLSENETIGVIDEDAPWPDTPTQNFLLSPDGRNIIYLAGPQDSKKLYSSTITPEITSQPKQVALVNFPYSYTITANDIDDDATLEFLSENLPDWLTLTDHGDGTATLSGRPAATDQRAYEITIQVSNDDGLTDTQSFSLNVDSVEQTLYMPIINAGE